MGCCCCCRRIAVADVLWRQLCISRFNTPPYLNDPDMTWMEVYRWAPFDTLCPLSAAAAQLMRIRPKSARRLASWLCVVCCPAQQSGYCCQSCSSSCSILQSCLLAPVRMLPSQPVAQHQTCRMLDLLCGCRPLLHCPPPPPLSFLQIQPRGLQVAAGADSCRGTHEFWHTRQQQQLCTQHAS